MGEILIAFILEVSTPLSLIHSDVWSSIWMFILIFERRILSSPECGSGDTQAVTAIIAAVKFLTNS